MDAKYLLLDQGCFKIYYREPILGGNRVAIHKTDTMLNAVAEFNTLQRTSGFDTPLRIERMDIFGNKTHVWTMDGRYSVPRLIQSAEDDYRRSERRRYRRYSRRSGDRV